MLNGEKSPWRSKPTPLGPRGLHPAGALARTHRNHQVQNTIPMGAATSQVSSKPQESARTPLEARGLLSDTTRRGTLSKNRKYCLSLAKTKARGQPRGLGKFSDSPKACAEASDERPKLSAPPRPSRPPRKASDWLPILRFARGWARQQPRHLCPDRLL